MPSPAKSSPPKPRQQQAAKKPQDAYQQRTKTLTSAVQRLRGWVGSDPSRVAELADALVELTAHRLRGHGFSGAADAQDAVRLSAQLLTATGPIGPYTSMAAAARCVTSVVHMASIQVGVGLLDTAAGTVQSLQDVRRQLADLPVDEQLAPDTAVWALLSTARTALAGGDVAAANANADAALARLVESSLADDPEAGYLPMDVDRVLSDCRWAAGRPEEALHHLHRAVQRYRDAGASRLAEPGRLSPALLERLSEPLFPLHRDLADRLAATGELDLALVTRRELVDTLHGLTARVGEVARAQLAYALADLAGDLLAAGRAEEAAVEADRARAVAGEAEAAFAKLAGDALGDGQPGVDLVAVVRDRARGLPSPQPPLHWEALPADSAYAASTAGAAETAAVTPAAEQEVDTAAWLDEEREQAHRREEAQRHQAEQEAVRRAAEQAAAERAAQEQLAAERAAAAEAERIEAERQEAAAEAERLAVKRRREERLEAHRLEQERLEAERLEQERLEQERLAEELVADDPAAAEQRELERLRAELQELERVEREAAEREAAERQQAERETAEQEAAERQQAEREAAERAEQVARQQRAERAAAEREVAERQQADREAAERQQQVEREAAERQHAEREAAERQHAEREAAERQHAEREAAERQHAEREAAEQKAAQREAAEREAAVPTRTTTPNTQPDPLALARQHWQDARSRGDRRAARAANEQLVELLRPLAETDLAAYGPELHQALDELSSARLRAGDLWGSRSAAKEARALTRQLGR